MLFKTEKKEVEKVKELIKTANSLVKKNNFENALSLYSQIIRYKDIDNNLKKDLGKLQNNLILYLKMNEAYILAKDYNFKKLKEVLNSIDELKEGIRQESPEMNNMINYITNHHNFVTTFYNINFHREKFNSTLKILYIMLKKKNTEKAVQFYQELLDCYKFLSSHENYEQKLKFYNQVKNAYTDLHLFSNKK